jgi:hypothetical protein
MNILLACEESQAVTIELRKRGHNAFSCGILPCSGGYPEWHIQDDAINTAYDPLRNWDMLIGFPPCTDLAVSGAAWFKQKRENGSQERAIRFFMKLWGAPVAMIALENPVNILGGKYVQTYFPALYEELALPLKPAQYIEPYFFGDEANKKTGLWLKNLPKLRPTNMVDGSKYITSPSGKRYPEWSWKTGGGSGHIRSKTFPGIAKAMAIQWG